MVYLLLYYISCLRYTILAENTRNIPGCKAVSLSIALASLWQWMTVLMLQSSSGSGGSSGLDDESTTTGIIIIAVVCCVVGTSLVWVIIIYQTRKRHEMYSATPTGNEQTISPLLVLCTVSAVIFFPSLCCDLFFLLSVLLLAFLCLALPFYLPFS